jgi:hypothetical protein
MNKTRYILERSKMSSETQMQAAWTSWIRDQAEMLEAHLAEVKHQGKLKLASWTPSLWKASPCHNTLWEQVVHYPHVSPTLLLACWHTGCRSTHPQATSHCHCLPAGPPATSSKRAWETFSRPNSWAPRDTALSLSHPWDKPAQPLDRLIPTPTPQKKILNE